jgi:Zn-dependent M28 family amino/carboxypeptidase
MKKRIIYLIIFTILAYISVKASTFGWKFWSQERTHTEQSATVINDLRNHVIKLSKEIGHRDIFNNKRKNLDSTADYISHYFKKHGYKVEYQEYPVGGTIAKNIIAEKTGLTNPKEIIIVGAHYDSNANPGADDNASGIAGLLELAKRMAKKETAGTLRFVAFANEEPPFFKTKDMGSMVYAAALAKRKENIKVAIIFDMLGYYSEDPLSQKYPPLIGTFFPKKANFIAQISNSKSREIANQIDKSFSQTSPLPIETIVLPSFVPGVDYSDHYSFWINNYRAVMFTDTAFYRNKNYHKASDTHETLNYHYMAELMDGLEAALIKLSGI